LRLSEFYGRNRPDDVTNRRFNGFLETIHDRLRAHFEACIWSTLSELLDRAYSNRFSMLAMELLGRRSFDDEALLFFFISRHLTPALAPRMGGLFSAIIVVQLARVQALDDTDDCLSSFVGDAVFVFGQAARSELFLGMSTSIIWFSHSEVQIQGIQQKELLSLRHYFELSFGVSWEGSEQPVDGLPRPVFLRKAKSYRVRDEGDGDRHDAGAKTPTAPLLLQSAFVNQWDQRANETVTSQILHCPHFPVIDVLGIFGVSVSDGSRKKTALDLKTLRRAALEVLASHVNAGEAK
jgi:hypothetical protein